MMEAQVHLLMFAVSVNFYVVVFIMIGKLWVYLFYYTGFIVCVAYFFILK